MREEQPAAEPAYRTLPREVQLIALLLLFRGVTNLPGYLLTRWLPYHYHFVSIAGFNSLGPGRFIENYLMPSLLAIAGIVIGIALLTRTRWALWGGAILLVITVLERFFVNFVWHHLFRIPADLTSSGGILNLISLLCSTLLSIAASLVMLYFLTTPRVLAAWEMEDPTNGVLTRWNDAISKRLPSYMPPVTLLIGLTLLCWAGELLIPLIFTIFTTPNSHTLSSTVQEQVSVYGNQYLFITALSPLLVNIGYLVSGLGLLKNRRWAYCVAITALFVLLLYPDLWLTIHSFRNPIEHVIADQARQRRNSILTWQFLDLLTNLFVHGTLIYFLLGLWSEEKAPVMPEGEPATG